MMVSNSFKNLVSLEEDMLVSLLDLPKFRPVILGQSAWIQHTPFAYWLMKVFKPSVFVELGTHYGVSYFSFCQSVKDNNLATKCYGIDTWKGDPHAGFYGDEVFSVVNEYNNNHYRAFSSLLKMTFDEASNYFEDESIDLLHIDGYHTYEAVKHDFETWLPKLAPGAIVLFHDTNVKERDFGVWKLWEELKRKYSIHFEFYHGYGLGVLQISEDKRSNVLKFLMENAQYVRNYFSNLGILIEKLELERNEKRSIQMRLNQVEQEKSDLQVRLNQVEDELVKLKDELELERNEKRSIQMRLNQVEQEKSDLQVRLNQVEDELVKVYLSKSCRITRPLRWIRRKLKI